MPKIILFHFIMLNKPEKKIWLQPKCVCLMRYTPAPNKNTSSFYPQRVCTHTRHYYSSVALPSVPPPPPPPDIKVQSKTIKAPAASNLRCLTSALGCVWQQKCADGCAVIQ